ncbi:ABC transporter ATP-binding protein [Thermoclostridium caenicola]|uniref:Carbohydrate ABC transporter ATP-binding protein, CUT1 family n=1 Tax=Thermoclostridium caenicola TaxID=659425 RepID=A0A1M6D1T6_9FIRM|nr:ABC transporter ATP-binding protein [Thermoclostridium caenicola]SHI67206.1 carbohydrate ABC transporter ATP-binding protein, CUT1 family [Thermoclostridium caenicola]HOL85134.1 ABC transporter ATP-binding protein [Thermoclostridium caenicola]HPO77279.1 ABC transporter ATP-binding protein [Thermoclostridium caenicola]
MAKIELLNITKRFGKFTALDNVNLEIKDNEFFVLFGPAGAGKTTLLNTVAGLVMPEEGLVKFNGEIMNKVDPSHRNVAMVFENYALYPNLTVYENIASPLRSPLYKKDDATIDKEVHRVAKILRIDHLVERLPSQLSNGQKQRVAIGRALVRNPNVFLMDEPIAHLDAKLRHHMRSELKEMQSSFNSTVIYVTHDFLEAVSLGDRIAIINEGKIVQVGTREEVYYTPCNEFVATLVGEPEINLVDGRLVVDNGKYYVEVMQKGYLMPLPENSGIIKKLVDSGITEYHLGFRPNNVKYTFQKQDGLLRGTVYSFESIGNKAVLIAKIGDQFLRMIAPNDLQVKLDQDVYVELPISKATFFNAQTTQFIGTSDEAAIYRLVQEQLSKGVQ